MKARPACGVCCLAAVLACGTAVAQGGRGMPGGGMRNGRMGAPGGGDHRGGMGAPPAESTVPHTAPHGTPSGGAGTGGAGSSNRGGLQLGPPGRWWDDSKFAQSLGLNSDQQKRMDSVFAQNRDALLSRYESLQRAETRLESLTRSGHPDEGALFSEIDHVAQARAELEKANTRMLLQIRGEMTPDQIDRLEDHR